MPHLETVPVTTVKALIKAMNNCKLRREPNETDHGAQYRRVYNSGLNTARLRSRAASRRARPTGSNEGLMFSSLTKLGQAATLDRAADEIRALLHKHDAQPMTADELIAALQGIETVLRQEARAKEDGW